MAHTFGKLNRSLVVAALESRLSCERLYVFDDPSDLDGVRRGDHRTKLVMVKGAWFTEREWLEVLASADFFVAAPGVIMPFSHNVVEAMAVGAVPILQYPELFSPPLEDGVNCIRYDGEDDLLARLERLFTLSDSVVAALRDNVVAYYETHLAPETAVATLMAKLPEVKTLYLNAEHVSVYQLLRVRGS
jgi:hypothetical protein